MTIWYARNDVPYSGGDAFISITFPYIKKEHIKVFVNDTETTNYVYNNETQIKINDTLQLGDIISVRRNTSLDKKIVTFSDTSILNKDTQNLAQDQNFNLIQELYDSFEDYTVHTDQRFEEYKEDLTGDIQQIIDIKDDVLNSMTTIVEKAEEVDINAARAEEAAEFARRTCFYEIITDTFITENDQQEFTLSKTADSVNEIIGVNINNHNSIHRNNGYKHHIF